MGKCLYPGSGTISCPYHGWTFDGATGKLVAKLMEGSDVPLPARATVKNYPVHEQLRLEWRGQDGHNQTEQPGHSASLGDSITSSTQIRFSVHTVSPVLESIMIVLRPDPALQASCITAPQNYPMAAT